jgi:DNA-binding MarR family transcriptional regulator
VGSTEREELQALLEEFLRRLFSMAEEQSMDILVDLDISLSQARTIFILDQAPEAMPIADIARRLSLSPAAAGRNVDQLLRLGIVQRNEDLSDRRVKLVSLTKEGLRIAFQHAAAKRQALRVLSDRLPDHDCARMAEALRPILAGDYLAPSRQPKREADKEASDDGNH